MKAMFVCKGYRWTFIDVLLVIIVVYLFGDLGINTVKELGVSLASVAGAILGFGTLIFIFVYPFPLFGGSVKAEKLHQSMMPKKTITQDEVKIIFERRDRIPMDPKTIKAFFLFFFVSEDSLS